MTRLLIMSLAVAFLLFVLTGGHFISVQMEKARADRELEEQKQIATELEAVTREMKDLELRIQTLTGALN